MNKLKVILNKIGISQIELAYKIGVSENTVRSWLNGTRKPTRDNMIKMETFFKDAGLEIQSIFDIFRD